MVKTSTLVLGTLGVIAVLGGAAILGRKSAGQSGGELGQFGGSDEPLGSLLDLGFGQAPSVIVVPVQTIREVQAQEAPSTEPFSGVQSITPTATEEELQMSLLPQYRQSTAAEVRAQMSLIDRYSEAQSANFTPLNANFSTTSGTQIYVPPPALTKQAQEPTFLGFTAGEGALRGASLIPFAGTIPGAYADVRYGGESWVSALSANLAGDVAGAVPLVAGPFGIPVSIAAQVAATEGTYGLAAGLTRSKVPLSNLGTQIKEGGTRQVSEGLAAFKQQVGGTSKKPAPATISPVAAAMSRTRGTTASTPTSANFSSITGTQIYIAPPSQSSSARTTSSANMSVAPRMSVAAPPKTAAPPSATPRPTYKAGVQEAAKKLTASTKAAATKKKKKK